MNSTTGRQGPWSKEQAWEWYNAQPWIRGCNYMPASAANRVDQWQSLGSEERFEEVERELALGEKIGFNALRLLVEEQGFGVWLAEHDSFMANFERMLTIMQHHKMRAIVVLGNDCSRPKELWKLPVPGEQKYDIGFHGGRRVTQHGSNPKAIGFTSLDVPELRVKYYAMCEELLTKYRDDDRILFWNLWNEPDNNNRGELTRKDLRELFELAWRINPRQPLAADIWRSWSILKTGVISEVEDMAGELSDIISFHCYLGIDQHAKLIDLLARRYGRPMLNTEWLQRMAGCTVQDGYALLAQRRVGNTCWGFVAGKYQTYEPYEPMWRTQFEFRPTQNPVTCWFHDLFRPSYHPYDPEEINAIMNINAEMDAEREGQSLRAKIAQSCKITKEDMWYGYRRTTFDFQGRSAWIVEPAVKPLDGTPWTWTMQWAEAYVDRTGVLDLLKRGFHHVTVDLFDTRMTDEGIAAAASFQAFLVDKLGFAPKANLVGMSWGGFFSVRYTAAHPGNVAKIYLDAPLLNFDDFGNPDYGRIGAWANMPPADGKWSADSRMPVNMAGKLAAAQIPLLVLYGGQDQVVPPARNCEMFLKAFEAQGGVAKVENRTLFGHHPHGTDPDKTAIITNFFAS